jgi:hypothetical protein
MKNVLALLIIFVTFGCSKKEPDISTLTIFVKYKYVLAGGGNAFVNDLDEGATVYLFPNVNLSTTQYKYDGKESVSDGTNTIKYFRKEVAGVAGNAVFNALPYGTHGIAIVSKGLKGKWISTSIKIASPTERSDFLIEP